MAKFWRRLHYFCALVAGLFILFASITGFVLALEPWVLSKNSVSGSPNKSISFSEYHEYLKENFLEVFELQKDPYDNIKIDGIGLETDGTFYISADSAKVLEPPPSLSPIFNFSRELHRSLFLKTPGRILVGLSSLALLFLSISGLGLLIKRSGGWKSLLQNIRILDWKRDGHAMTSRLFLIPILILAFSGTYLAVVRLIPPAQNIDMEQIPEDILLENVPLHEVNKAIFPIDESEPLILELEDIILHFDVGRGALVKLEMVSFGERMRVLNFDLHTAEGMPIWAFVLLLSALILIFLSITGFVMIADRWRLKRHEILPADDVDVLILVGSETGNTWRFADSVEDAYANLGIRAQAIAMKNLPEIVGNKLLLFLTSTYGDGDAPENAGKILDEIEARLGRSAEVKFSVLGFGSSRYPAFCAYALELRNKLASLSNTTEIVPYMTVDNQSVVQFVDWIKAVNKTQNTTLSVNTHKLHPVRKKGLDAFKIVGKKQVGETFLLQLTCDQKLNVKSGDLLAVYPPGENIERYYSIALWKDDQIILVIKQTGLCSSYLNGLNVGSQFEGYVKLNPTFYLPEGENPVLMISNGTGIAPFIGMQSLYATLLWGGRYANDLELFHEFIESKNFHFIYSREVKPGYVQELVCRKENEILQLLHNQGTIMICGSLTMYEGVKLELIRILDGCGKSSFEDLRLEKRILVDCY